MPRAAVTSRALNSKRVATDSVYCLHARMRENPFAQKMARTSASTSMETIPIIAALATRSVLKKRPPKPVAKMGNAYIRAMLVRQTVVPILNQCVCQKNSSKATLRIVVVVTKSVRTMNSAKTGNALSVHATAVNAFGTMPASTRMIIAARSA